MLRCSEKVSEYCEQCTLFADNAEHAWRVGFGTEGDSALSDIQTQKQNG